MAKRHLPPDDDGRTIVSMDALDMARHKGPIDEPMDMPTESIPTQPPLTRQEMRWAAFGALKATLLVASVFSAGIILFVLLLLFLFKVL